MVSERIHPDSEPADHAAAAPSSPSRQLPPPPAEARPHPAPGSYVIHVPKDQIYRVPTPETAKRFEEYTHRRRYHRSCCCRLLLWVAGVFLALAIALAVTAGVLYLVLRPKLPRYAVEGISVWGLNLTSRAALFPAFDVAVRAENPNGKVEIDHRGGGTVVVSQSGVQLCSGAWPAFYQGARNLTVVRTVLRGAGLRLPSAVLGALAGEQRRRAVPLEVGARVPVRVRFGAVTTWTVTAKVRCQVTVDQLTARARVVSSSCGVKVKVF